MPGSVLARRTRNIRRAIIFCALGLSGASNVLAQAPPSKGDSARGATLVATCVSCHGAEGGAPLAGMPALAGQQQEFLLLQMILLREGLRDVPTMSGMLKAFSDRDLIDIAAYYRAAKPFTETGGVRDPKRHTFGASLSQAMGCGSCHMKDYIGQRQVPRITHQREDYLAAALKAYRDDRRSGVDTSMNAVMYKTTDADIAALAHYFAHQ